jgi:uncharacterized protein
VLAPLHVLVPPSEAKAPGGAETGDRGVFDDALGAVRCRVVRALREALADASEMRQQRILGVRGERLIEARAQVARLEAAAVLPAWRRYQGVVWTHLDPATLEASHRERLLVPSGLYGLTTGDDPVVDYRLKMNVALPELGLLSTFWRAPVSEALIARHEGATVVDLLPREHAAALDAAMIAHHVRLVRVEFVDAHGAGTAGHAAKAVKGVLARRLLLRGESALERFAWEGWRLHRSGGGLRVVAPR